MIIFLSVKKRNEYYYLHIYITVTYHFEQVHFF